MWNCLPVISPREFHVSRRTWTQDNDFLFLHLNLDTDLRTQLRKNSQTFQWQNKQHGTRTIKFETARMLFFKWDFCCRCLRRSLRSSLYIASGTLIYISSMEKLYWASFVRSIPSHILRYSWQTKLKQGRTLKLRCNRFGCLKRTLVVLKVFTLAGAPNGFFL